MKDIAKSSWKRSPLFRSFVYFLAGLPLTMLLIAVADPLLEPVRQSKVLRLIVFSVLMVWILAMSAFRSGIAIRRQAREIPRSPALKAGPLSGLLLALNGIVFALAIIALIIFYATELL